MISQSEVPWPSISIWRKTSEGEGELSDLWDQQLIAYVQWAEAAEARARRVAAADFMVKGREIVRGRRGNLIVGTAVEPSDGQLGCYTTRMIPLSGSYPEARPVSQRSSYTSWSSSPILRRFPIGQLVVQGALHLLPTRRMRPLPLLHPCAPRSSVSALVWPRAQNLQATAVGFFAG